ncbi:hypothetical protein HDU67_008073 [Dinochytrium kinnereticum]|nr:hypothetical protein HDU67_008073 [Dinochytrium kinnereticum]
MLPKLPDEIILHLSTFLDVRCLVTTTRCSSRLRTILMPALIVGEFESCLELTPFRKEVAPSDGPQHGPRSSAKIAAVIEASQRALLPSAYAVLGTKFEEASSFVSCVSQALCEELLLQNIPHPHFVTDDAVQSFFEVDGDPWSFPHEVGTLAWSVSHYLTHEVMMRAREIASEGEAERVDLVAVSTARARWAATRVLVRANVDFQLGEDDAVNIAALRAEAVDAGSLPAMHPGVRALAMRAVTVDRFGIGEEQLVKAARRGDLLTNAMRIVADFLEDDAVVSLRFPGDLSSEHRRVLRWAFERGVYHRVIGDWEEEEGLLMDGRPTLFISKTAWPPF